MNKHIGIAVGAALLLAMQGAAWANHDGSGPHAGGNDGMGGHQQMMEQADTNHDGKISHDEFKAAHEKRMEEMFKKLDANGDGFIDKDEMAKGRDAMRERMREHMQKRQQKMQDQKPQ